jgi:hypothetical protein
LHALPFREDLVIHSDGYDECLLDVRRSYRTTYIERFNDAIDECDQEDASVKLDVRVNRVVVLREDLELVPSRPYGPHESMVNPSVWVVKAASADDWAPRPEDPCGIRVG